MAPGSVRPFIHWGEVAGIASISLAYNLTSFGPLRLMGHTAASRQSAQTGRSLLSTNAMDFSMSSITVRRPRYPRCGLQGLLLIPAAHFS